MTDEQPAPPQPIDWIEPFRAAALAAATAWVLSPLLSQTGTDPEREATRG